MEALRAPRRPRAAGAVRLLLDEARRRTPRPRGGAGGAPRGSRLRRRAGVSWRSGVASEADPMPVVEVDEQVSASLQTIWDLVNDVEGYPRLMEHVRSCEVRERGADYRLTA